MLVMFMNKISGYAEGQGASGWCGPGSVCGWAGEQQNIFEFIEDLIVDHRLLATVIKSGDDAGMDKNFSSWEGEWWAEASNIFLMRKGGSCDVVDIEFKGEVDVESDSKVADVSWGRQSGALSGETVRDWRPMMLMSDSSQLNLKNFECNHNFISVRQLVRMEWNAVWGFYTDQPEKRWMDSKKYTFLLIIN